MNRTEPSYQVRLRSSYEGTRGSTVFIHHPDGSQRGSGDVSDVSCHCFTKSMFAVLASVFGEGWLFLLEAKGTPKRKQ